MPCSDQFLARLCGWPTVVICAAVTAIGVAACSVESRDRMKHFFFEIPDEEQAAEATGGAGPEPAARTAFGGTWPQYVVSRHRPFAERRCGVCHDVERGHKPLANQITACTSCHNEFFEVRRYVHGPAASNQCGICHNMHTSRWDGLLQKPESALCVSCHEAHSTDEALTSYHRDIGTKACSQCHDPHFADNAMYLKPEALGTYAAGSAGTEAMEAGH